MIRKEKLMKKFIVLTLCLFLVGCAPAEPLTSEEIERQAAERVEQEKNSVKIIYNHKPSHNYIYDRAGIIVYPDGTKCYTVTNYGRDGVGTGLSCNFKTTKEGK